MMRINLNVPYGDKEKAKSLGAKWDVSTKRWYVLNPEDLKPFAKWMDKDVMSFYKANNV
jgi:hypothetical protein